MTTAASSDPHLAATASPCGGRTCKNCDAPASGKFCSECGQPTDANLPTVAEFVHDVRARVAAREGQIWQTLVKLFFAPGVLTAEYIAGRRKRYLRPLQLYLAASLIVFAVAHVYDLNLVLRLYGDHSVNLVRGTPLSGEADSNLTSRLLPIQIVLDHVDTEKVSQFRKLSTEQLFNFLRTRRIQYISSFLLFLVPLVALILKLVYRVRRRRYSEHLIFGLHTHAFARFIFLIEAVLPALLANLLSYWLIAYLFIALKHVYGGTWLESIWRGLLAGAAYFATYVVGNILLIFTLLQL